MKKILIIVIYFIASCGYQPLYVDKNSPEIFYNEIQLKGNKDINRKIVSRLSIKKKNNAELNNLVIESKENIIESSKDAKGLVSTYKTNIELKLTIKNENNIIDEKLFNKSFSYNNKDNKFDLAQYQAEVRNNIVNKIVEELIVYFKIK